jgi:hypothetical protein
MMAGDNSETFLDFQKRQIENEARCGRLLGVHDLELDEREDSIPWILNHIDYFVNESRSNERVKEVYLSPYLLVGQDIELWDKVGQAVGNLQALSWIHISTHNYEYHCDGNEEVPITDWEILARILSHVRQRITLIVTPDEDEDRGSAWRAENSRSFARAIHGHPTITCFEGGNRFPYECLGVLYSALATLPALESICLFNRGLHTPDDESVLANPESLTELLRVPSLRSVHFYGFYFTRALCHATANALMEGTAITKLDIRHCSFPAEESAAVMAKGLARNTSVLSISVEGSLDVALIGALALALQSNFTLQELSFLSDSISAVYLAPVLLALGKNRGIKTLTVGGFGSMDESLCTAMQHGLGMNQTLETLELMFVPLCEGETAMWCRAFSFLCTSKPLKSLVVDVQHGAKEPCLFAFRFNIAAMLHENTSLESLSIRSYNGIQIKAEEYFLLVTALQHNTALKSLTFHWRGDLAIQLTDDENKQMVSLLKKNYALERLSDIDLEDEATDVSTLLRLNKAGRRYLIEDGSSISKGVEVLSRVNNDLNYVFMHLLENPRLCDRRAVEIVGATETNSKTNSISVRSTHPTTCNGEGKIDFPISTWRMKQEMYQRQADYL